MITNYKDHEVESPTTPKIDLGGKPSKKRQKKRAFHFYAEVAFELHPTKGWRKVRLNEKEKQQIEDYYNE